MKKTLAILLLATATTANAQVVVLTKHKPAPFDTSVCMPISDYRALRESYINQEGYILRLDTAMAIQDTMITQRDSAIAILKKDNKRLTEILTTTNNALVSISNVIDQLQDNYGLLTEELERISKKEMRATKRANIFTYLSGLLAVYGLAKTL